MSIDKRPKILRVKLPGGTRMYDPDADIRRIMRPILFGIWQSMFDAKPSDEAKGKLEELERICGLFNKAAYSSEHLDDSARRLMQSMRKIDPVFLVEFLERFFVTMMAYHNGNIRLSQMDPEFEDSEYASFAEQLGVLTHLSKAAQILVRTTLTRKGIVSRMLTEPPKWVEETQLLKDTAKTVNAVRGGELMSEETAESEADNESNESC